MGTPGSLIVTQNTSADGRIEFLDDWFQPSPGSGYDDLTQEMERQDSGTAAMLLGRQTFEDFRSYWPDHIDEPAGASLDRLPKYVVSSTLGDPGWVRSTVLSGDPVEEARRLVSEVDGEVVVTGSITLTHALFAAGLVDGLRLFVHPAIQGRGRGLLAEGTTPPTLSLQECRRFDSGVVFLQYAVTAG